MKKRRLISGIFSLLLAVQMVFATGVKENVNIDKTTNTIEAKTSVNIDKFNDSLSTQAYVVIDSKTGEKIIGKNEDKVMYPASLTKIMTSLLLLESGKINDEFLVSKDAAAIGETSIYVQEGEKISGKDLLYAMMLQSANDACYVVAEGISGSAEAFYTLMTERAKALGATNSNFTSANGLHEEDHVTTAMDLALITKEALKYDVFREVIREKSYELTRTAEKGMKKITNKNRMLFESKPEYNQYSIGGKTAYTTPAGNCLMEVAEKDGMEVIVISMKSGEIYKDTNKIINFTFDNFKSVPVIDKTSITQEYKGMFLSLYGSDSVAVISPVENGNFDLNSITTKVFFDKSLGSEISTNQKVGIMNVYLNDNLYRTIDLYSAKDYIIPTGIAFEFTRNVLLFSGFLVLLKIVLKAIKYRKEKTKGYLKNSNLY